MSFIDVAALLSRHRPDDGADEPESSVIVAPRQRILVAEKCQHMPPRRYFHGRMLFHRSGHAQRQHIATHPPLHDVIHARPAC